MHVNMKKKMFGENEIGNNKRKSTEEPRKNRNLQGGKYPAQINLIKQRNIELQIEINKYILQIHVEIRKESERKVNKYSG